MRDRRPVARSDEQARPTRPDVPTLSGEYRRAEGPARHATVQMAAVRMLDDDLGFDAAEDDLDIPLLDDTPRPPRHELPPPSVLDSSAIVRRSSAGMSAVRLPSGAMHAVEPLARRSSGGMQAVQPPMRRSSGAILAVQAPPRTSSSAMNAVDPHAVYTAFAKFGDPPATIWQSPRYALHVLRRKRTLERELEGARRRGSPDVALYEAALRTADAGSVRAGIAVICAAVSLLTLLGIAIFQVVRGALVL